VRWGGGLLLGPACRTDPLLPGVERLRELGVWSPVPLGSQGFSRGLVGSGWEGRQRGGEAAAVTGNHFIAPHRM
jgi:hypothetical protein